MEMLTKQQTFATLVALICIFSLVVGLGAESTGDGLYRRLKRQAASASSQRSQVGAAASTDQDVATRAVPKFARQDGGASALAGTSETEKVQLGDIDDAGSIGNKRRKKPKPTVELDVDTPEEDEAEEERPRKTKKARRKRPMVSKQSSRQTEDDDESCHELDDYDYGNYPHDSFHEAATRPMRHFSRMMEGMFSQMQGLRVGGANSAIASASSNGDDYSRASSVVTNNGRTRGIVTETKDGRTRTRRIDSGDDEEDED